MRFPSRRALRAGGVAVVAVAVAMRFAAAQPLWLDETLSVNIARLPLGEVFEALRHDGSPPLYYLLLHAWIGLFGEGTLAVRALSGVIGVATIPAAWAFAREITRSRQVADLTALVAATSPFAMRYATEARMYALVMLLVALGGWALVHLVRGPSRGAFAGVALCTGGLLLTHYWALYVVAVMGLIVLVRRDWRAVAALVAGGLLFLPWLPSFRYQLAHTGTPWAPRPQLGAVVDALTEWSGIGPVARLLFVLLFVLALLGVFGSGVDGRRIELDLRGRPVGRRLAALTFGTLLFGVLAGIVLRSGYAARYTAVVAVPFLVLVAIGATTLLDDRLRATVVGVTVLLGVATGIPHVLRQRTQAGVIAATLRPAVGADDVVVYCPDQLGPAVARLLPGETRQEVFPTRAAPHLVDWVDYGQRNEAADPVAYADDLLRRHPRGTVWLVVAGGYKTFEDKCERLAERLRSVRAEEPLVRSRNRYGERSSLVKFAP
ncbi:MAG TPA: glycosyltransferase family 39 protein [Frankiaceae bacterium]|nr:glycosyltransferase family 39 protein [Frankiaceae bacterium]